MTSSRHQQNISMQSHSWSLVVTRGHSWSTRAHSWSLVVIRGHSWSLVVTRGHSCVLLDTINANRFICDNIFRSLSVTGANTRQEARRTPLVALNWLERRYEIYTSKSLGRERSKSWAKSVVSTFRRSLRVASPRFARARVYFARPTIAIAKIRDYSQSTFFRAGITITV